MLEEALLCGIPRTETTAIIAVKQLLGDRRFANFSHKAPTRRGKSYILGCLTR